MSWNLDEALSYYGTQGAPKDQTALINLFREVQEENNGGIPEYLLERIAEAYAVKPSFLRALVKRIPSLRLSNVHCLELCAGPNCSKRTEVALYAESACRKKEGVELKYMPCMRMCAKGPNMKWDGVLYHQATKELIEELLEKGNSTVR